MKPKTLPVLLALTALLGGCGGTAPGADDRPNVVLVVLDTLRRDACGSALGDGMGLGPTLADGGELTPNLARIAAGGAVFTRAFSAAPWTVPAHASLFTGLLPSEHGCIAQRPRLLHQGKTTAELLKGVGYQTAAFFSNPWLSRRATGVLRGFDVQEESPIGGLGELAVARGDQGGPRTLQNIERWLDRRDQKAPFFLFVNLFEAHLPYDPPAQVRSRFSPPIPGGESTSIQWGHEFNAGLHPSAGVDWEGLHRLYAADVNHVDELFGQLVGLLEARGVFGDAALIVTSDHGENLGEHGLMEHQFSVHETLLSVPLVAHLPGIEPGRYDHPVSTADVHATLARLADVDPGSDRPHSLPLSSNPTPGRPVFSDYFQPHAELVAMMGALNPSRDHSTYDQAWRTVRTGKMRLTVGSLGGVLLHDMEADRGQLKNLAGERPRVRDRLIQQMAKAPVAMPSGAVPGFDKETRDKIRGVGYAAGDEDG